MPVPKGCFPQKKTHARTHAHTRTVRAHTYFDVIFLMYQSLINHPHQSSSSIILINHPHRESPGQNVRLYISHKGHNNTIHVYSVTVMTHVMALHAGQSSQGHLSLLHRLSIYRDSIKPNHVILLQRIDTYMYTCVIIGRYAVVNDY